MNFDHLVASRGARAFAATFAVLAIASFALGRSDVVPDLGRFIFLPVLIFSVLTFMGIIFSFRPLYTRWMKFADALQVVVMTILFGGCYLIVVPFFVLIVKASDPLGLRGRPEDGDSYWVDRHKDESDIESYRRMA